MKIQLHTGILWQKGKLKHSTSNAGIHESKYPTNESRKV